MVDNIPFSVTCNNGEKCGTKDIFVICVMVISLSHVQILRLQRLILKCDSGIKSKKSLRRNFFFIFLYLVNLFKFCHNLSEVPNYIKLRQHFKETFHREL